MLDYTISPDREDAYATWYPWVRDHIPQLLNLVKIPWDLATLLNTPLCSLEEIDRDTLIINIPAITTTRWQDIVSHNDIPHYIEKPLCQSVHWLWDNNIQTIWSSANFKNVWSKSYVYFKVATLSDENKNILLQYWKRNTPDLIEISMSIWLEAKFADIEDYFLAIVSQLRKQPLMRWYSHVSLYTMTFGDPLYDWKYDKRFFSAELKLKANDTSIALVTEEVLRSMFAGYGEDDIKEYMQKAHKAWHFFSDDFRQWVNVLWFDTSYQEYKTEIKSRSS